MKSDEPVLGVQAAALAGLLWPGRPRWRLPAPVTAAASALVAGGAVLSVAGAAWHGARLTPRVEPRPDAPLLTDGPYRLSRNPIYAGLLVGGTGLAVLRRRAGPLVALAALAAALHVKTGMEEERLLARFGSAYADYAVRTPRLVGPPRSRLAQRRRAR